MHRQDRMHHNIGQHVDDLLKGGRGRIDIIDRAVECRVGIDRATDSVHLPANGLTVPTRGPLKKHVLQIVREAGAEEPVFVDAPGLDPDLHRNDLAGKVRPVHESEAIGQRVPLNRGTKKTLDQLVGFSSGEGTWAHFHTRHS